MNDFKELKEGELTQVTGGSVKLGGNYTREYKGTCCGQAFTLRGDGQLSYKCGTCQKLYALKSSTSQHVLCDNEEFAIADLVKA